MAVLAPMDSEEAGKLAAVKLAMGLRRVYSQCWLPQG